VGQDDGVALPGQVAYLRLERGDLRRVFGQVLQQEGMGGAAGGRFRNRNSLC
jgi:hypothetical protein